MERPVKFWSGGLTNGVYVVSDGKLKSPLSESKYLRECMKNTTSTMSNQIFSRVFQKLSFLDLNRKTSPKILVFLISIRPKTI